MTTFIGFDLGTKTAWAMNQDGRVTCGLWVLTPRRFDSAGMRFFRFRRHVSELLDSAGDVTLVAMEEVRAHSSVDAAHIYGGLLAILMDVLEARGIQYTSLSVGTIKKHATGKGNAPKEAMIDSAQKRWPEHAEAAEDDNTADALWILDLLVKENS